MPASTNTTGSNLTVWQNSNAFYFDPTNEVPSAAATGEYIYIASGTGFTPGLYQIQAAFPSYSSPGTNGDGHNLLNIAAASSSGVTLSTITRPLTTIAATPQGGAVWGYGTTPAAAQAAAGVSAYSPPVTTPNTAFTGTLNGVKTGDSVGQYEGNLMETKLKAAFPNGTVSIFNACTPGDTIDLYAPGNASGRLTSLINYLTGSTRGGTVSSFCHITLGKNNTKVSVGTTTASFQTQMQALVNNLFAGASALRLIAIDEITYTVPGSGSGDFTAASNTAAQAFNSVIRGIPNASAITSLYSVWAANASLIATDGVHPSTSPAPDGQHPGVGPGYDALAAIETNQLQPMLANLSASRPAAPAALTAAAPQTSVLLTVAASTGATGYRFRRDGATTPIYDGGGLTFTDTFAPGTSHTYTASAYNTAGESALTAPVTATSTATSTSTALTLTVTPGAGVNNLAWSSDSLAVNGYAVVWFPGSGLPVAGATGEVVARTAQGTLTWSDTSAYRVGLSAGSRYDVISLR